MTTDLVPSEHGELSATLFGTSDPAGALAQMTAVAKTLEKVVRTQNLIVGIGQSEHVKVEGWTFLGSLLGVFPVVMWTRPVLDENGATIGWEARVEARTRTGEVVGAAEAECLRSEAAWSFTPVSKYGKPIAARDDYALRSMAQTRAVSKALRLPLGFVMQLAGFNPTPAEEMTIEGSSGEPRDAAASSSPGGFGESAMVASPDVQDVAAGTPFQYEVDAPVEPAGVDADKKPTKKQNDALDSLVKQLEAAGHITVLQVWQSMGITPTTADFEITEDNEARLRWSPLRDQLTRAQAHQLLNRLIPFADEKLPKGAA